MGTIRVLRNLTFVVTLCVTFVAMQARVLAMGSAINTFCNNWAESYNCSCTTGGYPPGWEACGSCDFSSEEDPETLGAAYCQDEWSACVDTCGDEYPDYLVAWYASNMDPNDECYGVWTDPGCWITWAGGSCYAGAWSSWNCVCESWNYCEC